MKKLLICLCSILCLCPIHIYAVEETADPESTSEPTAEATEESVTTIEENTEKDLGPDVEATSAILIDTATGTIIARKNSTAHLDPAWLTKIMTVYLACENLKDDASITMSSTAYETYDHSTSVLWLMDGETLSALDLEYASLIQNANDATAMLVEAVSGSEESFIKKMNSTASSLEMYDTNFENVFGLNNENNYSSAKDLAILVRKALKNDTFAKVFGASSYSISPTNLQSQTRTIAQQCEFLRSGDNYNEEVTGCKIGYTSEGGYTLAVQAERNGTSYIAVVLGEATEQQCYNDALTLFEYGFNNYHTVVISPDDIGTETIEIYDGKKVIQNVTFSVQSSFSALLPTSISKEDLSTEIVIANEDSNDPDSMSATVNFLLDGEIISTSSMQKRVVDADSIIGSSSSSEKVNPMLDFENLGPREIFDYACIGVVLVLVFIKVGNVLAPPK